MKKPVVAWTLVSHFPTGYAFVRIPVDDAIPQAFRQLLDLRLLLADALFLSFTTVRTLPPNTEVAFNSLNPIDWKLRKGHLRFVWPLKFPFTPGFDVSGIVEATGEDVSQWKIGDKVYGALPKGGGHAEYVAFDEALCVPIPSCLTFDEAAAIPGGALSALQALRDVANARAGSHVVVNGASGGVGTFAVQIAVALGCRVTAVTSTRNVELVQSLGADAIVDYTRDDVLESGPCDVFFDVVPPSSIGQNGVNAS